ncbi:uncharacterized protein PGTG_19720 [Puccinia graminis f. sp. tritici CRL 75-36-700-3]|uniref:Uncharacterized protein n=1 Tax=Puccinia graminis f. sp. tritici (strain CRL 75-36-700-3 / race SCCL) TaxID=418459 RepID=E3LB11_PUCGT|nr:uncharacterized protein PGTG_19720 [Puccinia graminis f. sp. tritici CRL 75-36-700-3]EFP93736.1 hypothetical protein PGTG_19720 [Puccinia graminis f. sp. tritici CRL 75-36-700-3]
MSGIEPQPPINNPTPESNRSLNNPTPESNRSLNNGMGALTSLVENLCTNVTSAAVTTLIKQCEIFEGLDEEEEASLYLAAGIPPPGPDAMPGTLASYELQIRTIVVRTLDGLDPEAWEDDDQFRSAFLAILAAEQHWAAHRNGLWWHRVCEFRRLIISDRITAQGEEAPARNRIVYNRNEVKLAHHRAIWVAEQDIARSQQNIQRAERTILTERQMLRTIAEEERRERENADDVGPGPNIDPSTPVPTVDEPVSSEDHV